MAYYHALVGNISTMPCPNIPLATDFSFIEWDSQIHSEHCTVSPASETILALRKCGCIIIIIIRQLVSRHNVNYNQQLKIAN